MKNLNPATPRHSTALLATIIVLMGAPAFAAKNNVKADNSSVNTRDLSRNEVTAQDQSTSQPASETARLIRIGLTSDETLSTYAKNVKIIVIEDLITLKGPVNSDAERMKIVRVANNVAPTYKIENQIQVVK